MEGISITPYTREDLSRFQEYIRAAFHDKYILADERFLEWQYTSSGVLMLARRGSEIVGHFGWRDFPYKVYEESRTVRVVMNLFVEEKYWMAGVGPLLVKNAFDTPYPILVSGYNEAARQLYPRYRSNWREAGNLSRFMAVLKSGHPFFKSYQIPKWREERKNLSEVEIRKVTHLDDRSAAALTDFWRRVRNRYPVTIEREPEYLGWRFFGHPHLAYSCLVASREETLAGFLIWRIESAEDFSIARIIDFVSEESAERALLDEFLDEAGDEGAAAADFMFSGPHYRKALGDSGFFDIAGTDFVNFPIRFSPVSYSKLQINIAYDIPAPLPDCYITKADSDQDRPNPH